MLGKLDFNDLKNSLISNLKNGENNKRWPNDEEFTEQLKFNNKEANKDFKSLTVEHILPRTDGDAEKLSDNWKRMLGDKYKDVRDEWINRLGNLTLTGYNSELSANDFDEKKKLFIESGLRLNKQISEYAYWNEESIKDRADKLIKVAIQRWGFFN